MIGSFKELRPEVSEHPDIRIRHVEASALLGLAGPSSRQVPPEAFKEAKNRRELACGVADSG